MCRWTCAFLTIIIQSDGVLIHILERYATACLYRGCLERAATSQAAMCFAAGTRACSAPGQGRSAAAAGGRQQRAASGGHRSPAAAACARTANAKGEAAEGTPHVCQHGTCCPAAAAPADASCRTQAQLGTTKGVVCLTTCSVCSGNLQGQHSSQ